AFVAKYDAAGTLLWVQQFGNIPGGNGVFGITADNAADLYITGNLTGPNAPGTSPFIAKYFDGQPGDFHHDGVVNVADSVAWRKGLGTVNTQNDYDIWRANFGAAAAGAAAVAQSGPVFAVPEPAALGLIVLGLLATAATRREKF